MRLALYLWIVIGLHANKDDSIKLYTYVLLLYVHFSISKNKPLPRRPPPTTMASFVNTPPNPVTAAH
jgi:hypothetical protein